VKQVPCVAVSRLWVRFGELLASQLTAWVRPHHPDIEPAAALRAILIWSRLHGIVSLEISGNFASIGIDPTQLFETQLASGL
jgi:Tetracyclin repressor-like, C-terminal domain